MKLLQCNYETIEIPEKKWNYDSEIIGIDIPVVAVDVYKRQHVYNEEGEEVLTYTGGVGWQEKETKAESQVHSALKMTYYLSLIHISLSEYQRVCMYIYSIWKKGQQTFQNVMLM